MKLFYCNTKHQNVLRDEYFLPSIKDDIELCGRQIYILSNDDAPVFNSPAFKEATLEKIKYIVEILSDNVGQIVVYSDVDIQFFKPFKESIEKELTGHDIVMQRNQQDPHLGGCTFCTGFFASKVSEQIVYLWKEVYRFMKTQDIFMDDQKAFNYLIKPGLYKSLGVNVRPATKAKYFLKTKFIFSRIKINCLPEAYFTPGLLCLNKMWRPGMSFTVPPGIILHHANWTVGLENKIAQLRYVRDLVRGQA